MLRKLASKLALLAFSVVVTLVLAEVGLRIAHVGHHSWLESLRFFREDPYVGVALHPGAAGMVHLENDAFVRINRQGQHDHEHSPQKPPNSFRIAVLGDSFAEAMQVPFEKNFSSVLQRELGGCGALKGKQAEVINFGVHGFGTAQELQMLRHYVWAYSPDLVLLGFFTGNDVQNNSRELQQDPYRPYFVHQNGRLVLDDSFVNAPGFHSQFNTFHRFVSWSVENSRVLQLIIAAKHYAAQRRNADGTAPTELGDDDDVYHEPKDAAWREAWSVTEDLITTMRDEVRAQGAQFLLVTLSTGIQVDPDPAARESLEKRFGVPDLFYADDRIAQLAKREDIPVLTLAPIFLTYAQDHHVRLHGFHGARNSGHWNELGHELGGDLMAQKVCEMQSASFSPNTAIAEHTGSGPEPAAVSSTQNRPVTP